MLGQELSEKRLSFCSPFVCDKALPLPCCVSPGETLTSLSQVLLGVQGGAKSRSAQLDLNAVSSTGKEAKKRSEQGKKKRGAGDDGGG